MSINLSCLLLAILDDSQQWFYFYKTIKRQTVTGNPHERPAKPVSRTRFIVHTWTWTDHKCGYHFVQTSVPWSDQSKEPQQLSQSVMSVLSHIGSMMRRSVKTNWEQCDSERTSSRALTLHCSDIKLIRVRHIEKGLKKTRTFSLDRLYTE